MKYSPGPVPLKDTDLREYLHRELGKVSDASRDDAKLVFYRTSVDTVTLSAGTSANFKFGRFSNITRVSTSVTVTLTGIADKTPYRERVFFNVGTGVLVLKSEGTESSASHRFALPQNLNLSANAAAVIWFDPISSRHRCLSHT